MPTNAVPLSIVLNAYAEAPTRKLRRPPIDHGDVIEIPLTGGMSTYVDPVDRDHAYRNWYWLTKNEQNRTRDPGKACFTGMYDGKKVRISLHVIIAYEAHGEWDRTTHDPDHIDGDPLNNRRENIRVVPKSVNSGNARRARVKNTYPNILPSLFKGKLYGYYGMFHYRGDVYRTKRYETEYDAYMAVADLSLEVRGIYPPDHHIWSVPPVDLAAD